METDKKNPLFPSDFLSPTEKGSKEFALKWCEAMHAVGINGEGNGFFRGAVDGNNNLAIWRAYARGNQSIDKYKPTFGINGKVAQDRNARESFLTLNWEILDIASKYVNVLIGKLIKQNNDIGIRAIDAEALKAKIARKMELEESVMNRRFRESVTAKTGIAFQEPVQEDLSPLPETYGEIDTYQNLFEREEYCLVMQDLMKKVNETNNYVDILSDVARNFVEVAEAATRVYRVGNNIRMRSCNPDRMGMSSTTKSACDDVKWIYEDWDLTIGQLKEICGDEFTEKEYRDIAENVTKTSFNNTDVNAYRNENLCYPWDNTKITVKDAVWFSPDWETVKLKADDQGNTNFYRESYDWWEGIAKKGVSVEEYNKANDNQVIRYSIDNQYSALWIVGTKYVAKYGKSRDMLKNESDMGKTVGPFCIYKLKKSLIESIIPVLDNIQINWLQYQHHAAKSRPAGLDIEFTALQDISLGGAGGTRMKPKDVLRLYFETGIILWRRGGGAGNQNNQFRPINELQNGMSPAMKEHFMNIINNINLLRDQVGLNELTDASTPNSEMGKAVALMASGASEDALRGLHFGFDQVNLGTHERVVLTVTGMAQSGMTPADLESLGISAISLVKIVSEWRFHQLGCYMMKLPSNEMKLAMQKYIEAGIKAGSLLDYEAIEIENEPNPYKQVRLLKFYRQQKLREAEQSKANDIANNAKAQTESALAVEQAKQAAADAEWKNKAEYEWEKARATAWANRQKVSDDAFLIDLKAKRDNGEALTLEQERRMTDLMKIDRQGQWAVKVAQEKPAPAPAGKK